MSFVNPTYLWAFWGLLIPVVIHFWSNKKGKIVRIGSVKFLEVSDSAKSRSIKLNEYLLLFLRLLLLSLLVLILAEPELKHNSEKSSLTYLIEPSLLENRTIQTIIDSVKPDTEVRVFRSKFPELDRFDLKDNKIGETNYWQLVQLIDDLKTDSIVIFTSGKHINIKGNRPNINKPIKWIVLGEEVENKSEPLVAFKRDSKIDVFSVRSKAKNLFLNKEILNENSNKIKANSNGDSLVFKSKKIPLKESEKLGVLIAFDKKYTNQLYYFEKSIRAIEKFIQRSVSIEKTDRLDELDRENQTLFIWLSDKDCPKTKGKILQYKEDDLANNIIEDSEEENIYNLTELLTAKKMIETNFINDLLKLLSVNKIEKTIINKADNRLISEIEIQTNFEKNQNKKSKIATISIINWLWLPFIFLLIIERFIAKYRKQ